MKKRIITVSLIVASLILLVSVGFAGWVISTNHEDTKTGNFTAYDVTNNGTLTVVVCNADGTTTGTPNTQITYGKPSSALKAEIEAKTGFNKWLDFSDMNEQVLVVYLKLSLEYSTEAQTFTLTNAFKKNDSVQDVYNLIAAPTYAKVSGEGTLANDNEVTLSDGQDIVISVTYNWGSEFGGLNPYEYFNLQNRSTAISGTIHGESYATYERKANVALDQLNLLVDDGVNQLTYSITVADKPSA